MTIPIPRARAHAVAVGLTSFVGVADGLEQALRGARSAEAALVAAHPYPLAEASASRRGTGAFLAQREYLTPFVDRFELFNRHTLFGWIADAGYPVIASGDFHRPEHLASWKTLIPCEREPSAVVDYLRSTRPAYLVPARPCAGAARPGGVIRIVTCSSPPWNPCDGDGVRPSKRQPRSPFAGFV